RAQLEDPAQGTGGASRGTARALLPRQPRLRESGLGRGVATLPAGADRRVLRRDPSRFPRLDRLDSPQPGGSPRGAGLLHRGPVRLPRRGRLLVLSGGGPSATERIGRGRGVLEAGVDLATRSAVLRR